MMDATLVGSSEANERLKRMVNQKNTGKVEYPSGTNERGYPSMREHHASGDMVGGEMAAPGRGGSQMKPLFGAPKPGRQEGAIRQNAIRQANGDN